ncbi:MAG: FimV/HubP family polar landmark protein [Pseudomonadales bacterium]
MLKRSITLIGLSCTMSSIPCLALGLGPIQQQSYVDEPLKATVDILDIGELNIDSISVVPAGTADFLERGLSVKDFIGDLETVVIRTKGQTPFVQLSSVEPVRSAILNFALKARWENGSLVQQYTVLMNDLPTDNVENFSEEGAQSALSDLEMLESEAMSTQQKDNDNKEAVWNLDKDLANRTEWLVSDERSLQEIAVHMRPSNTVSIQQMVVALIKKNAGVVQQRQSLALNEGDVVQLPTHQEIVAVNKLSAGHELGALQARFQFAETAANESVPETSADVGKPVEAPRATGRLSLGSSEPAATNNTSSTEESMKQQSASRTKSTDLARRLENVVARLGDANQIINNHIHEISDLNLLVEDLKHTIDLKNSELADLQARVLGAMQAQDSVENSAKTAIADNEARIDSLPAQAMNDEAIETPAPVVSNASANTLNQSVLGGFLAIMAALVSIVTFARFRAKRRESMAVKAAIQSEQLSEDISATNSDDTVLHFEDEELQQLLDKQKGSVIGEAEVLTAHGLHNQAIAHLQAALDEDPESAELIGALREALILSGKYEQAAELFPELESANDNAVIDSDYIKQTLVIDDLEEPFDESKPPVWEPPAASVDASTQEDSNSVDKVSTEPVQQSPDSQPSSTTHNSEKAQPVVPPSAASKNDPKQSVSEDTTAETKKTTAAEKKKATAAEKAAARKQSRRAKKAKAAKRQQHSKEVKANKTKTIVSKKVQTTEVANTVQAKPVAAAKPEMAMQEQQASIVTPSVATKTAADKSVTSKPIEAKQALETPVVAKTTVRAAAPAEREPQPEVDVVNQQAEQHRDNSDMFTENSEFFTEVEATPFELVQAYIELDDRDGARRMLEDILGDGKPNEKARAKELLEEFA